MPVENGAMHVFLSAGVGLLVLICCASAMQVTPERAVEIALEYHAADRKAEAQELLERVVSSAHGGAPPGALVALGAMRHEAGQVAQAIDFYNAALQRDSGAIGAYNNLGKAYRDIARHAESAHAYARGLALDPHDSVMRHQLALSHHYAGQFVDAQREYERVLHEKQRHGHVGSERDLAQLHYDYAVTLQHGGMVQRSAVQYNAAIKLEQNFTEAWLNLAGLHHKWGDVEDAIRNYKRTLLTPGAEADPRLRVMVLNNLGIAFSQHGQLHLSLQAHERALQLLQKSDYPKVPEGQAVTEDHELEHADSLIMTHAHLSRARKVVCDWHALEARRDSLLHYIETTQLSRGRQSSLMPFDTLHLPVHPIWSLRVATIYSDSFNHLFFLYSKRLNLTERKIVWPGQVPPLHGCDAGAADQRCKLRLGYICYDFNDHPTAHLVEGLFHHHNRSRVIAAAYNYGRDDNSTYRRHIVSESDDFVELVLLSHEQAATKVARDRVNILIDLQGHTRGGRPEITAMRPAPIIVNYLIFAGTMGAAYMDYLISDRTQTPGEYVRFYREKMVLMPHSYQVNYYLSHWQPKLHSDWREFAQRMGTGIFDERVGGLQVSAERAHARGEEGLPPKAFVFANFNKNDKLEPNVFGEWMAILRALPGSVLWLLESQASKAFDMLKMNLRMEAAARGVAPHRIFFAPRRSKKRHLSRHWLADCFLDTHIYGAHSTATDALRGGVPVLTMTGRNFAGRVATGLLRSVNLNQMITKVRPVC